MQPSIVSSQRLDLIPLSLEFLSASLERDKTSAERILGLTISQEWFDEESLIKLRLNDLQHNPTLQPWILRAVVVRDQKLMIGHIGFHTAPNPDYLKDIAPGGIEFGYTIFTPFRQQGYAREASEALMKWANHQHRVKHFVLSIRPDNTPSLRIAQRLGFRQVGSHIDEEDGLENIYLLAYGGAASIEDRAREQPISD